MVFLGALAVVVADVPMSQQHTDETTQKVEQPQKALTSSVQPELEKPLKTPLSIGIFPKSSNN